MDIERNVRKEVISISGLEKVYSLGKQQVRALDGVSLSICKNEYVAIMGPSGSGKSTLMNLLGCLDTPSGGKYVLNGTDVSQMGDGDLAQTRNREIGFVFQFHHLLPEFTALENVVMPALIGGAKWGNKELEKRALMLLEDLGVGQRASHKPMQMSGGEQQRVAVARALMNNPAVLFADEPSGNLDSRNKEELHNLFFGLREKYGQTIVIVTHEMDLAAKCDRCIVMKDGAVL